MKSNAFAGRTNLNVQLGYALNFEGYSLGAALNSDLVQNNIDIQQKDLNGVTYNIEGRGGKSTALVLFFEMPSESILWGLALSQHWVEDIKIDLNGSQVDNNAGKNYSNFSVYSRLDTGRGQELNVKFGYDILKASGNDPSFARINEGSGFSILTSYSVEF
ncbi:MAG: hypothetical protein H6625_11370 [Bdellovibrionaceae bacterium]|nr:hypothetical protein [Pseudobdellovibrionaceae bacterium]